MTRSALTAPQIFPDAAPRADMPPVTLAAPTPLAPVAQGRARDPGGLARLAEQLLPTTPAFAAPPASESTRLLARCTAEGWEAAPTVPVFRGWGLCQAVEGGSFVVVRVDELVTVGLGTPLVIGARAFFAWDEGPLALRLRSGHDTLVVGVEGGRATAYREPGGARPDVRAWLSAPPDWLAEAIDERLATETVAGDACAVGLALRLGPRPGTFTAAEVRERAVKGLAPPLVEAARDWATTRVESEWGDVRQAAYRAVGQLTDRVSTFDHKHPQALEQAIDACLLRDDIDSMVATLRLVKQAENLDIALRELDTTAGDALPVLADVLADLPTPDPHLEAVADAWPDAWWGRVASWEH